MRGREDVMGKQSVFGLAGALLAGAALAGCQNCGGGSYRDRDPVYGRGGAATSQNQAWNNRPTNTTPPGSTNPGVVDSGQSTGSLTGTPPAGQSLTNRPPGS